MKRMLTVALLPLSALTASFAQALGLGELTLNSSLNQKLEAEIRLINVKSMSDDEIIASLASQQDFARAGIERVFFLTDLDFEVRTGPQGEPVILVSSQKSVKEPFLNFLVEVNWPNGRLLREYTVLLDPPVFDEETAVVDVEAPTSVTELPPIESLASESGFRDIPSNGEGENVSVDELFEQLEDVDLTSEAEGLGFTDVAPSNNVSTYRVKDNDTLWQIAVQVKPSRAHSTQQTMLALQDLNPDSFINNNINLLKKNQVLRVPTEGDIQSRSKREAFSQVKSQNKILAQKAAAQEFAQLDGTLREDADGTGASADQPDGELKLVSPGSVDDIAAESAAGDPGKGQTGQEALARLRTTLSINQENLDKANRENVELRERLEDLEAQIETLQSLISLKDNQMSALQSALSGGEQSASNGRGVPEPVNGDIDDPFRQAAPEESFFQGLLKDPRMFGGLIAAIVVVLGMLFFLSRNSLRREKDYQQSLMDEVSEADFNNSDEISLNSTNNDSEDFGSFKSDVAEVDEVANGNVNLGGSFGFGDEIEAKSDVMSEASIYISYGRTEQAQQLLNSAIEQEPQRADLRLKLMEVFASTGDNDSFDEQLQAVQAIGDADATQAALEMSEKLYSGASDSSDDLEIDGLDLDIADNVDDIPVSPSPVAAKVKLDEQSTVALDDDNFSLDDLDLDELDTDIPVSSVETHADVDFDMDTADSSKKVDDDILSFDLDDEKDFVSGELDSDSTRLDFSSSSAAQSEPTSDSTSDPYDLDDLMLDSNDQIDSISLDESDSLGRNSQVGASSASGINDDTQLAQSNLNKQLDDADLDDDFDFLVGTDEAATKLDLARAYIDMDDRDGARDILDEVAREGNDEQRREAAELLKRIA